MLSLWGPSIGNQIARKIRLTSWPLLRFSLLVSYIVFLVSSLQLYQPPTWHQPIKDFLVLHYILINVGSSNPLPESWFRDIWMGNVLHQQGRARGTREGNCADVQMVQSCEDVLRLSSWRVKCKEWVPRGRKRREDEEKHEMENRIPWA